MPNVQAFPYLFSFYIKIAFLKVEQRTCIVTKMDKKTYNLMTRFLVRKDESL